MLEQYPNTPIIYPNTTESIYHTIGYILGDVIFPVAMILYVILHFRDDKHLHLYAVFMVLMFLMFSSFVVVASGIFLIGIDVINKWVKKRKAESSWVELKHN